MTPNLRSVEEVATKQKQEAELAVFWDIMASALPKSIERSALGDEKIFTAFAATYPQIKAHIAAVLIEGLEGKRWDDTCGICDGVAVNVHLRNGEDCPHCNGTGIDRGCYTHNQALDTAIALIKATLDVTSEEK